MAENGQKLKANPLPFWSILAFFYNFLKTVQKQSLTAFESFSKTLNVILGLFKPFLRSWKYGEKRPKSKGLPLTTLVNFSHFFNFLKTVQKERKPPLNHFQPLLTWFWAFLSRF